MSRKLEIHAHLASEDGRSDTNLLLHATEDTSWAHVITLMEKKLSLADSKKSWAFQYLDDESDMIFGRTEDEWQEAVNTGCEERGDHLALHVSVFPFGGQRLLQDTPQACEERGRMSEIPEAAPGPCAVKSSCCQNISDTCCGFKRPVQPDHCFSGEAPQRVINESLSDYKYSGEALRAVALPLGPIGGGSIAIAGDGGLRQWQISNCVCHTAHVPDSFFAIRVDQDGSSKSVVLQSNTWYNQEGFQPAAYITDHVVPSASVELLNQLPGVKTVEVTAKYPTAEVDYVSGEVPVQVHLEAFNPCIPLDSKNSGIPTIIFNYTVTNTTSKAVKVSLLGSLQNIAGWDGKSLIQNEGYGGNSNELVHSDLWQGIEMGNSTLPDTSNTNGQVALGVLLKSGDQFRTMLQYASAKKMWGYFTGDGLPGQGEKGPSPAGTTWNGALSCAREIQPNKSEVFTFMLGWHFPHRFVNWNQAGFGINDPKSLFYIGNYYSKFWPSGVKEVLDYTATNMETLFTKTKDFRDSMFDSTLPWQMIDSAAGRVSVIRSPTTMWLEDGNVYMFEGCSPESGCCPLNCTHVCNYEMALSRCFPDLERTMRNVDLKEQIAPNAVVPSRTTVPLELRRIWTFWKDYITNPASTSICVDGEIGTVLKVYRELRQKAPKDWVASVWPKVKDIMHRWMTELDDGSGTIPGPQPNTYDCSIYGKNTFIGALYVCALRAAQEMAVIQGEADLAAEFQKRFKLASENLDKACYVNGKWYTQVVDPKHAVNVFGDGTFVDCLLGQWWAHSLGLGYILPQGHVVSTLQFIFTNNHVDSFNPADQSPRHFFDQRDAGLYIVRWPDKSPEHPLLYSSEGAWTGLEYEFAGLCLYEGLNDVALRVLTDARNKYDGTRRSPWNEIECGDHYVRPMGSFLFFEIASGQSWEYVTHGQASVKLGFAPRLNPDNFRGFFILPTCWGQYSQTRDRNFHSGHACLRLKYGSLELAQFQVATLATRASVTASNNDGKPLTTTVSQSNGLLTLGFKETLKLEAGDSLYVTFLG